jgi:hypothetical protein
MLPEAGFYIWLVFILTVVVMGTAANFVMLLSIYNKMFPKPR